MIAHQTVFEKYGNEARRLLRLWENNWNKNNQNFAIFLCVTHRLNFHAEWDTTFEIPSIEAISHDFIFEGDEYTLWLDDDAPDYREPFVILIRSVKTTLSKV